MDRIILKATAKQQISDRIGVFLVIGLIFIATNALLSLIPAVGSILAFAASSILSVQLCIIFLKLTNGIEPEIPDLFDIFKNSRLLGNAVLLNLLITIFTTLWTFLFIIPGIIKGLSYYMAPYILAENEYYMSPQDAIKESMRIMDGHKLDLFVLQLSFIGWYLLSVITCGLGFIYVLPYYKATITNFYNEIKDTNDSSSQVI